MAKIRVHDLAKMMGIELQDLIFKLKSIGVAIDEKNPQVDPEVLEAVLKGKALHQPREVILRDREAKKAAGPALRKPPQRRMPTGLKPPRRRMIQRVEPRIRTIPTSERAKPAEPPAAAAETPAAGSEDVAVAPPPADGAAEAAPPPVETAVVEDLSGRRRRRVARRQKGEGQVLEFKEAAPEGPITISEAMTVREFAEKLGVKAKDLIKLLFDRGIMATINHVLEPEIAIQIAEDLGLEAMEVSFEEEILLALEMAGEADRHEPRAPVVTIMGHVDHGKTTLLDSIRRSKVTETEFGGITQHIGAYEVEARGRKIVFLDTPGHEAFTRMRARGAQVTDLVVLVVAADDSVMPQTIEAIDHAKAAGVPILVAINKIDKGNVNVDRVKKELADHGVAVEEWGGETVAVPISALKGDGIDELLEMLLLNADLLELKADSSLPAQGTVVEARKEAGRGIVATVLVQDGSLEVGDVFVAGATWGRVRAMQNDVGQDVRKVGPATPVEVTGFGDVPEAGDPFQVVEEEARARSVADFRQEESRRRELAPTATKISLDSLFEQISRGETKELPVVLKADVQGSVEVLTDALTRLSTDKVGIQIIHSGVGAITTNDILLASASNAIVVGFNVRPEQNAADLADKERVDLRLHTVIYELSDEIKKAMTGLLEPTFREVAKGRAEVREIFSVPKRGVVAGCHVVEGTIPRNAEVRLLRDNVVIHEGSIASLRRFKDDVGEVRAGFDCGIRIERFQDVKPGDIIEAFVQEEVAPKL